MKKINSEKKNKLIENSILVGIYSFTVWYILVFLFSPLYILSLSTRPPWPPSQMQKLQRPQQNSTQNEQTQTNIVYGSIN